MRSPGGKEPLWPSVRRPRTDSSKEKAHVSKNSWHLNTVYTEFPDELQFDLVRIKMTIKWLTRVFLRTRKDYSSEVSERHVKTVRLLYHPHEENIFQTNSRGRRDGK